MEAITPAKGIQYMVFAVFCFALMNACAKSLPNIGAHELVFFRSIISFSISFWFIRKENIPILGNNRKWLLIRGFTGLVALTIFLSTIKHMPLASASTIQYLSPIFTVLFGIWINQQKVNPVRWILFAVAFMGAICIKGFDSRVSVFWLSMGVLASAIAGLAYNAVIRCRDTDHPITIVMYFPMVAIPITGIACLFDWKTPHGMDWLFLLGMGITAQIAQYFTTRALHSQAASKVTPWNYFGALFSLVIGYFIFDEQVGWLSVFGMVLIISAVVTNSKIRLTTG